MLINCSTGGGIYSITYNLWATQGADSVWEGTACIVYEIKKDLKIKCVYFFIAFPEKEKKTFKPQLMVFL